MMRNDDQGRERSADPCGMTMSSSVYRRVETGRSSMMMKGEAKQAVYVWIYSKGVFLKDNVEEIAM